MIDEVNSKVVLSIYDTWGIDIADTRRFKTQTASLIIKMSLITVLWNSYLCNL